MSDIPYSELVILALVAGFILLRLRSVLGQKTDLEKPPELHRPAELESPVVQVSATRRPEGKDEDQPLLDALTDPQVKEAIVAIRAADAQFRLSEFLAGARGAFEMVLDAFRKGDRETLKMLLSDALYVVFDGELKAREQETPKRETTLVSLLSADPVKASFARNTAQIGVRFVSEQVTVLRDASGAIVGGNASHPEHVEDEWLFERDVTARNPNWKIIDT